ncbi:MULTISPECIES: RcnB family protein [Roseobacteraceae]|uniref:Nickel/cobalt transporter regulator n=1 Tax=Pseudosulfitobacter pseudonitzschiae TaxID=1402135 RepID=A0A221K7M7_9RHOB|nr:MULTISPECIES: RcnB family protein [Roseobacteraceae]ASM75004.1 nickel/cobalt transporter regulator [Pseudosulfitobacter pseudonitzschiae]
MKRLILAATASMIALSGAAQADPPRKHNNDRGNAVQAERQNRDSNHRGNAVRAAPGQVKKQEVRRPAPKQSARRFAPGQRMPQGYRAFTNYRDHGLPAPGRGYRYVRHDNNVYKISTETAMIAAVIGALSALR